jgi:hypothetical protein
MDSGLTGVCPAPSRHRTLSDCRGMLPPTLRDANAAMLAAPNTTGVPDLGTPVDVPPDEAGAYFSPISLIFTLPFRLA